MTGAARADAPPRPSPGGPTGPGSRPLLEPGRLARGLLPVGGLLTLLASMTLAVTVGPADISTLDVWRSVAAHLGFGTPGLPELRDAIVWELRAPRVITAAAVGGGLAIAGAVMQSVTRNPLADPYLLGLSSGASLGAVLVIVLGVGVVLPLAAFGGALVALAATMLLSGPAATLTPTRTVLAGVAVAQLGAAATSFVIFWSSTGDSYREILTWLLGSLGGADWRTAAVSVAATGVVGVLLVGTAGTLDALAFGDTSAAALGVDVTAVRPLVLVAVALLTGALVSVSGSIGFVGLVLPHAVRLLVGARHRLLLPLSALAGAVFLVWTDTAARTIFEPRELPVGILTALVGAPAFAWLLWRHRGAA